jgi:hypothetical protein
MKVFLQFLRFTIKFLTGTSQPKHLQGILQSRTFSMPDNFTHQEDGDGTQLI